MKKVAFFLLIKIIVFRGKKRTLLKKKSKETRKQNTTRIIGKVIPNEQQRRDTNPKEEETKKNKLQIITPRKVPLYLFELSLDGNPIQQKIINKQQKLHLSPKLILKDLVIPSKAPNK